MVPSKGKGVRSLGCPFYGQCLDLAARKNWRGFNCERCPFLKMGTDVVNRKGERMKMTEDGGRTTEVAPVEQPATGTGSTGQGRQAAQGETATIEQFKKCNCCDRLLPMSAFPTNRSCKDGHEGVCKKCRKERNKEKPRAKKASPNPKAVEEKKEEPLLVAIDFQGYPEVLESLRLKARAEMRPLDLQIIRECAEGLAMVGRKSFQVVKVSVDGEEVGPLPPGEVERTWP